MWPTAFALKELTAAEEAKICELVSPFPARPLWRSFQVLDPYIIFLLPPYSNRLSRSIRKDRRVYFFDCAAAYDETDGAQLENLVACSLLKYAQFRKDAVGESWKLFYDYTEKLRPHGSLQLVLNLDRAQEKSGIKILPLSKWLAELPFQMNAA
jgi:predicted AAA+ superfamily ATPase